MITRKTIKLVKSLHQKKYRYQHRLFLVEGAKSVLELIASAFTVKTLLATEVFLQQHKDLLNKQLSDTQLIEAEEATLSSLGHYQHNNAALAVVEMPSVTPGLPLAEEYTLALDALSDPGNLGTIIRIADWYGVRQLVCSSDTTDVYAPKVIGASMGSFLRVKVTYTNLPAYLERASVPVYGAALDQGSNIHQCSFGHKGGVILMGSESSGIRPALIPYIDEYLHIPRFGRAESLNVGVATAVILDNLKRLEEKTPASLR